MTKTAPKPQEPPTPIEGKTHEQWLYDLAPEVAEAQKMIEETLSVDASVAAQEATMTENAYCKMALRVSEAERWLEWWDYKTLLAQDQNRGTASERAIERKVLVGRHKIFADKLNGVADSLKARMRRATWRA